MQGYRTYMVAGLMAVFSVLSMMDWNVFLNDPKAGAMGLFMAILMAVMRSITTIPAGSIVKPKDPK